MDLLDPDLQSLVIDNGSGSCKVGFGGDSEPKSIFPTLTGHGREGTLREDDWYSGNEALETRGILELLRRPISRGSITDWNSMEKIWHYSFYKELRVTPEGEYSSSLSVLTPFPLFSRFSFLGGVTTIEHPVLMTEPLLSPRQDREKMTSIMFETFNVKGLYLMPGNLAFLVATGRVGGSVLACGAEVSTAAVFSEGRLVPGTATKLELGGSDVDTYLIQLLKNRGYDSLSEVGIGDRIIIRDLKERSCFVAPDGLAAHLRRKAEFSAVYELPDGSCLKYDEERFRAPEALFQPSLIGERCMGLHQAIHQSFSSADTDLQESVGWDVVIAGGSTMFEGFRERLTNELTRLSPTKRIIISEARPERKIGAWVGMSVVTTSSAFLKMWISSEEYDEEGPAVVHRKCQGISDA